MSKRIGSKIKKVAQVSARKQEEHLLHNFDIYNQEIDRLNKTYPGLKTDDEGNLYGLDKQDLATYRIDQSPAMIKSFFGDDSEANVKKMAQLVAGVNEDAIGRGFNELTKQITNGANVDINFADRVYYNQHLVEAYRVLRQLFPNDEDYDNIFSPKEEVIG